MPRPLTGTVEWTGTRWRARITLSDGSRPWVDLPASLTERQEDKAKAKARELAEYARAHGVTRREKHSVPPDAETVSAYITRWIADRKRRGIKSTVDNEQRLRKHVVPVIGKLPVASVTPKDIRAVVAALDDKVVAEELAWKSAADVWGLVSKLFADACGSKIEALRVRESDPSSGVAPPDRGVDRSKTFLYPSEFLALVSCTKVPRWWRRLYALAVYLYAREGELDALDCESIDLERGVVLIHCSRGRDGVVHETKGKAARRVPIEPALLPLLRAMVREREGKGLLVSIPRTAHTARGLRLDLETAGVTRVELFVDDLTRKPLTFHDLRATGITWSAVRGVDPWKLMQRAGHADLATTQGYIREADNYREGFGEVFPPLPSELLEDDGAPVGGGGFRHRESSKPGGTPRLSPGDSLGGRGWRRRESKTLEVVGGRENPCESVAPSPETLPDTARTMGVQRPSDDSLDTSREVLVRALGDAVRRGLVGGDDQLVRVAARALAELVDPGDGRSRR